MNSLPFRSDRVAIGEVFSLPGLKMHVKTIRQSTGMVVATALDERLTLFCHVDTLSKLLYCSNADISSEHEKT